MKVLFVSSGNNVTGINPIIFNQGESLKSLNISLIYFTIKGKGIFGYLKNLPKLKKMIQNEGFDIVHAHYSASGVIAYLAGAKNLVVSLMGSDISHNMLFLLSKIFSNYFWKITIAKSLEMSVLLNNNLIRIIPNGVNLEIFKPLDKIRCREVLEWNEQGSHILFAANPTRKVKNYNLANNAIKLICNKTINLHTLKNVPHRDIPIWINASDVVILTSHREGSPNVIKEAMACNRPIVTTNVGDVGWLLDSLEGCFIASSSPNDFAEKVESAIEFSKKNRETKGRVRIKYLNLDSASVAKKIIQLYQELL